MLDPRHGEHFSTRESAVRPPSWRCSFATPPRTSDHRRWHRIHPVSPEIRCTAARWHAASSASCVPARTPRGSN